jgi:putative peptide zinc metalloprotease protein
MPPQGPPAPTDVERRKRVRIRIRPDLAIAPQKYEGRTYYVVKDPVSLRYYRFKEQEHFLINLMDGEHTLDDAQKEYEKRFRPERLTLEDLEGFAQQLLTAGLAQNESPQAGKQLFDRRKKRRRSEWMQTLTNILYIKIPVYDPDRILTRLLEKGLFPDFLRLPIQMVFYLWTVLLGAGTIVVPLLLAGVQVGALPDSMSRLQDLVSLNTVFFLLNSWLTLFVLYLLSRNLRFIFTKPFWRLSQLVMAAALVFVAMHWETFYQKLPSYHEFFSFKQVVYLWAALGIVKVIHEFGHGLSCKAFGGEVHEMGLLFLVFSPCLYCNVSDAWTLPNKWKRIIISWAGIHVELIIAAIATFVWWNTPSQPFINNMSLSLMVVCSVSTVVFNANPLMRYDGYYILADLLEIPNLRDRSNRFLQRLVMDYCLGIEVQPEQYMALWRRVLFVVYAIVSYIYRWVVTFSILYFMSNFLKPYKLGAISGILACAAAGSLAGWPIYRLGKNIHKRGRLPDMKPVRVTLSIIALVAVILFLFLVPLPVSRVRQQGLVGVQSLAIQKTVVPTNCILEHLRVRDGQSVEKDQLLAEFRSLEWENQLEEARAQRDINEKQYRAFRSLVLQGNIEQDKREQLRVKMAEAQGEFHKYADLAMTLESQMKELELKAPVAGVVMSCPHVDDVGKLYEKGTVFCSVGDPTRLYVTMPVEPADYNLMRRDLAKAQEKGQEGLPVTVRIQGRADLLWKGKISGLPESEAKEIPVQLTNKAGGQIAVKPSSKPDHYQPQSQQYLVSVDIVDSDRMICPGTMAQVKVHCQWRTAAWWAWRRFSSAFDLGMDWTNIIPARFRSSD